MVIAVYLAGIVQASQGEQLAEFTFRTVDAILKSNPVPNSPSKSPTKGVFVTIEANGKVLGCRGTLEPSEPSLELEIQRAARSATIFDPRYHRVRLGKNSPYAVTLTIVERTEPLGSIQNLIPQDGLILRSKSGVGIVLPYEGKDPAVRLDWAYTKAKTPRGEPVQLERLIAQRYRYPETR
jgi:AMMECR1 domain-containing protein